MKKYELLAALFESELDAFILCNKRRLGIDAGNEDRGDDFCRDFSALGYNLESSPNLINRALVMDTLQRIEGYIPDSLLYFYAGVERALDEREVSQCPSCNFDSGEPCSVHG